MSCATFEDARASTGDETSTAPACVFFSLWAYLGFARKVSSEGAACSIPATPVISRESSPPLISHPRADASSESFISPGYAEGSHAEGSHAAGSHAAGSHAAGSHAAGGEPPGGEAPRGGARAAGGPAAGSHSARSHLE